MPNYKRIPNFKFALVLSATLVAFGLMSCTSKDLPIASMEDTNTAPSAAFPFQKKYKNVLGSEMAFIDEGTGDPIVFLHGNPTSSYLWRNIIPYVTKDYRAIAPDLIGMGDSGKPAIEYRYRDHMKYLTALLDSLDLKNAIFVIHDWGSGLGLHYMRENPDKVKGVVFLEAVVPPNFPFASYQAMGPYADFMKKIRTKGVGEKMILEGNIFVEQLLKNDPPEGQLSEEIMAHYRAPYKTEQSRLPTLVWPREIPVNGDPADVYSEVKASQKWFLETDVPKLLFHATPGAIISPEAAKWISKNVKNVEAKFLGPGGHFLQEVYPDEIGQGISDWLGEIDR